MAYQINRYDNSLLTVVQDGTIDQSTDIKFVGKNYAGYGEIQNENFVFLLENFASANPPSRPISGQIWYDNSTKKLKFYDGTRFKTGSGAEISAEQPSGLSNGDLWFDSGNDQLYAFNGSRFILIGPRVSEDTVVEVKPVTLTSTANQQYLVLAAIVNNQIEHITSNQEFTLSTNQEFLDDGISVNGFTVIKKGMTLINTDAETGVTSNAGLVNNSVIWGTSSDSLRLGGRSADDYVLTSQASSFGDEGVFVGDSNDLHIYIDDTGGAGTGQGVIAHEIGNSNSIRFETNTASGSSVIPLMVNAQGIEPGADAEFNLGSATNRWKNIYATNIDATINRSETLKVGTNYYPASVEATPNTIPARDSSADIYAREFNGIATRAKYADLAEKYTVDQEYTVGTIMMISNNDICEAVACEEHGMPIGVISEKPAYLMNDDIEGQAIGLKGRVPVRVIGPVKKGDIIYSYKNGVGNTTSLTSFVVGVSLESTDVQEEKLVECVLKV